MLTDTEVLKATYRITESDIKRHRSACRALSAAMKSSGVFAIANVLRGTEAVYYFVPTKEGKWVKGPQIATWFVIRFDLHTSEEVSGRVGYTGPKRTPINIMPEPDAEASLALIWDQPATFVIDNYGDIRTASDRDNIGWFAYQRAKLSVGGSNAD